MTPRLWQRQPGEGADEFTAFTTYLRLKGRRSHRAVAASTGRSLAAIRRLSARFNWPFRVAAFETRLADASQNAMDRLVQAVATRSEADVERLREAEFQLARRVLAESDRWLRLASDPRRRNVSIHQVCHLIALASKLGRLAAGMPTGDEPRRRPRWGDSSSCSTGPSVEQALAKIYGDPPSASPVPSAQGGAGVPPPAGSAAGRVPDSSMTPFPPVQRISQGGPVPGCMKPVTASLPPAAGQPPPATRQNQRRDAWAAFSRHQRRQTSRRPP